MRAAAALGLAAVVGVGLAGCGDRAQTAGTRKADTAPYAVAAAASGGYGAGQWAAGDEAAWHRHIVARMQGQNEYVRTGTFGAQPASARVGGVAGLPAARPPGMAAATAAVTPTSAPSMAVSTTGAAPATNVAAPPGGVASASRSAATAVGAAVGAASAATAASR